MNRQELEFKNFFEDASRMPMGWVRGYLSTLERPTVIFLPNETDKKLRSFFREPISDEIGNTDRVLFEFNVQFIRGSRPFIPVRIHNDSLYLPWKSPNEIIRNANNGYPPREFYEELKNYFALHSNMTWFMYPTFMLSKKYSIVKITVAGMPTNVHLQNIREVTSNDFDPLLSVEDSRTDDDN